jgi:hypothetical protein
MAGSAETTASAMTSKKKKKKVSILTAGTLPPVPGRLTGPGTPLFVPGGKVYIWAIAFRGDVQPGVFGIQCLGRCSRR